MNKPEKSQGNNGQNVDNERGDSIESPLIKSEQNNGSLQAETEALESPREYEVTGTATKELLEILGIIAVRVAAKRQKQGINKT